MRLALVLFAACEATAPAPAPPPAVPARPSPPPAAMPIDAAPGKGRVVVTDSDPCGLVVDTIYFAERSSELAPAQAPVVDGTAEMFRCVARIGEVKRWRVVGGADAGERDGERLARERAQTVIAALVARGVSASTLELAPPELERGATPDKRAYHRNVKFFAVH